MYPSASVTAHQEEGEQQQAQPAGPPDIDERPIYDQIDYVYDQGTEGDVAANDTINGSDFTTRDSEWGFETDSNEVLEVFKIEMIPPEDANGFLHTIDHLRLRGDGDDYDDLRYREFMLGFESPDFKFSTPILGVPVLSGQINPNADPLTTACPKYGPSTNVTPALTNNGTAIDDSFTIRLHVWRWKGTDQELSDLMQAMYGTTTFPQNIAMTNPFTGSRRTYNRDSPNEIRPGASGGAMGQFTELAGGVDQALPKVRPWVTWSDNDTATTTNNQYKFDQGLDNVSDPWKELEFDLTDQKEARIFNFVQINSPDELEDAVFHIDERDRNPYINVPATSRHQLPTLYPMAGPDPTRATNTERTQGPETLPRSLGTIRDLAGRRIGTNLLDGREVIWDDGGGLRVIDNGNAIAANDVVIGVQGRVLQLTS